MSDSARPDPAQDAINSMQDALDQSRESSDEDTSTLLGSMNVLSNRVALLVDKLDISAQQQIESARQSKWTRRLSIAVACIVLVGGLIGAIQWQRVNGAIEDSRVAIAGNTASAVQACENANDSRAANLALWTTVLGASKAGANPGTLTRIDDLLAWVALLYQPHDCGHLDRVYDIPPPPDLTPGP